MRSGSTDCNLHTIVRLPQTTFHPATVSTNLLFFQKGTPTKEIWYYEHRLPVGQKSYSKTKVMQFNEFAHMIEWWDQREESEVAWRVRFEDLNNGFDLDVRNPNRDEAEECLGASHQFGVAENGVERRAKLMAHVGKELRRTRSSRSRSKWLPNCHPATATGGA